MAEDTQIPTVDPQDVLFRTVYVPEFVKQCAARGLTVDLGDTEQVGELLKIAYNLRVRAAEEAKTAAAGERTLVKAASAALEFDTFGGPAAQPADAGAAAAALLDNPEVAKAAAAVVGAQD